MRAKNYVSADEWRRRLNECMAMVLAEPERFPEATVLWARWRLQWLSSHPDAPVGPARTRPAEQYSLLAPPEDRK